MEFLEFAERVQAAKLQGSVFDLATEALPTVRIALFGLGNRGSSLIDMLEWLIGQGHAEITAISDINPDKIQRALDRIAQFQTNAPRVFTGDDNAWKEACTTDVATGRSTGAPATMGAAMTVSFL